MARTLYEMRIDYAERNLVEHQNALMFADNTAVPSVKVFIRYGDEFEMYGNFFDYANFTNNMQCRGFTLQEIEDFWSQVFPRHCEICETPTAHHEARTEDGTFHYCEECWTIDASEERQMTCEKCQETAEKTQEYRLTITRDDGFKISTFHATRKEAEEASLDYLYQIGSHNGARIEKI